MQIQLSALLSGDMWEEAKKRTQIKLLTSLDFVHDSKHLNTFRLEQDTFAPKTFLHLFFSGKKQDETGDK